MQLQQRAAVIHGIADHRSNHAKLIDAGRDVRKELAHFDAAPAMLFEFPRRLHQPADVSLREGERSLERKRLAVIPNQPRLGVERIDARWAAVHEEKDHALGLWLEMGSLRSERIVARLRRPDQLALFRQQGGEP